MLFELCEKSSGWRTIVPDAVLLTAIQSGVFQPDSRSSCVPVSTAKQPARARAPSIYRFSKYRDGPDAINRKGSENRVGSRNDCLACTESAAKPEGGLTLRLPCGQ